MACLGAGLLLAGCASVAPSPHAKMYGSGYGYSAESADPEGQVLVVTRSLNDCRSSRIKDRQALQLSATSQCRFIKIVRGEGSSAFGFTELEWTYMVFPSKTLCEGMRRSVHRRRPTTQCAPVKVIRELPDPPKAP
jgi:hypothetical protein